MDLCGSGLCHGPPLSAADQTLAAFVLQVTRLQVCSAGIFMSRLFTKNLRTTSHLLTDLKEAESPTLQTHSCQNQNLLLVWMSMFTCVLTQFFLFLLWLFMSSSSSALLWELILQLRHPPPRINHVSSLYQGLPSVWRGFRTVLSPIKTWWISCALCLCLTHPQSDFSSIQWISLDHLSPGRRTSPLERVDLSVPEPRDAMVTTEKNKICSEWQLRTFSEKRQYYHGKVFLFP